MPIKLLFPSRWEPTRAPSPWEGVLQAITPGPVCPQSLPSIPKTHNSNGSEEVEALLRMPRPRLRFLQLVRSQLLRQSEDCLYLNIFVPETAAPENIADGKHCKKALFLYITNALL
jgi:carboxylesterase type B